MKGFLLSANAGTMSLVSVPLGLGATYGFWDMNDTIAKYRTGFSIAEGLINQPVAVPDSGGTLAMLGFGLLGLGIVYRLWRRSGSDADI